MAQIICRNIEIGYDGRVIAPKMNFEVNAGDYLCIVGENGSGKSTLMKTMLSLVKPMSGSIVFGDGVTSREIGYLPQQNAVQRDFPASVWEIVLSGCASKHRFNPFYTKSERDLAKRQMARMGIESLTKRCYRELSGGQQQRVLLARALCASEKIILLDEPVGGLDVKVTEQMYELIDELNKKDKLTVIMISHDLSAALRYSNKILYIGNDYFFGNTEDFVNSKQGIYLLGNGGIR